ncbi:hypothetical protein KCP70_07180 [Salmonella enterica subsp. enterica]|nr:hypothetical protein KCP70_07180 [Salmonella enterica subsp. enterica]
MVKPIPSRVCQHHGGDYRHFILIFTDRYLVAMMVPKPLERIRRQFQRIAQGDLSLTD